MEEREDEMQPEELEQQRPELLPDRKAMSTILPGLGPGQEPIDIPLDAPEQPAPE